jgi:predicted esterase
VRALLPILAALLPLADAPRGLVERVVCADHPDQSYAVYAPSAAGAAKPSPVLYLLDARGRALLPIQRFREAADAFGWILVSSYNSRSDTAGDPNGPALAAMWNDSHTRLAIDPARTYFAGFSGGGRAAVGLASRSPKPVAGVIGCGAGFPDPDAPLAPLPFAYFGTVGDRDFNYGEMRLLDERLAAARATHRVAIFPGGHDWPPPEVAREALAWMELQALRSGARPADEEALASLYRADLAGAAALADAGRGPQAFRRYESIAADFRGLRDTAEADARVAALRADAPLQKALREEKRRDARDRDTLASLARKLGRAAAAEEVPPVARVASELQIASLKNRAARGESEEERLSAQRILSSLRVQTSFYLPRRFLDAGDPARAVLMLSVAAEIDPDAPSVYYDRAAAHARAGETGPALADLQRAVDRGFRDFDELGADPDFGRLRESEAFRKWLADVRARV